MPSPSALFIDAFSDTAERYAQSRPTYPPALFAALAAQSPARSCAWDCGTGNGQAALPLTEYFEIVQATDASAEQIAHAAAHPRLRYAVRTAEDCGLPAASVDLISVAQAAHWFDLPKFFAEVRRVARPGAVLALYGYDWFYMNRRLDALAQSFLWQPTSTFWSPNNRLLWDGYRTIDFPFEELPRLRCAIHLSWTLDQLFDFYVTVSSTRRKIAADGDAFLHVAREQLTAAWGDPAKPRHVVMPMHVRWGRVS